MRRIIPILVTVLMLGTVALAEAQVRGTGIVSGVVTDADGEPLPGVSVTATSPALIGQQVVYTGVDGSYRIPLLPPGNYRVVFQLQGFATVVRENVDVGVRRTSTVNLSMQLATVEETITVTAKSPLVDVKSTKGSSEYGDELRNTLPETRGTGADLMALAPEATIPQGGQQTSSPTFFGSPTNSNAFQVDGVTVTDPGAGFQFPFYSPDWFDVVELTTTGASAEYGKAMGSVFNVTTKSGGNEFHGEFGFFFQNNSFIGDNTEGLESDFLDFSIKPKINHRADVSANIGGPLIRDKVWFFVGYQLFDEDFQRAGFSTNQTENSDRVLAKATWQANQDNRLIVSAMSDTFTVGNRFGTANSTPDAVGFEPSFNLTPNITWNSVLSPDAFLEFKYSGFYGFFDVLPITDNPASFDLGTGALTGAYWGTYAFDRERTNFQGNLSYFVEDFAGNHSFKFGAEYEITGTDDQSVWGFNDEGQNFLYYPIFGEPYYAYSRDPAFDRNTSDLKVLTLFAQDDWTIANRLTVNLGLRYDRWDVGWKGASRDDAPTFNDLAPRIGANYDVFGDGRTAIHAFWGRFYEEVHGSAFDDYDPNQSKILAWIWGPLVGAGPEWVRDPGFDSDPLVDRAIDPDLTNVFSEQLTVGIDHQITEDIAIGAKFIHKEDKDIYGGQDIGTTFVPTTVLASNGQTINAFTGSFNRFTLTVNNPTAPIYGFGDVFRDYNGFQLKVTKRLSNNWSFIGSWLMQKAEGNISNSSGGNLGSRFATDNPNDFVNTPGELGNSRRHTVKLQASYLLPDPIRLLIGTQIDWASSARWTITELFSSRQLVGFSSDRRIPIEPIGSRTINNFVNINLRAEKKFRLPGNWGDLGVLADVFNLTNENRITDISTDVNSFGEIEGIQNAREWRIALRWLFEDG